ncbi:MAG: hypothetical protein AAFZ15_17915 [Bacteroidota bacterium]
MYRLIPGIYFFFFVNILTAQVEPICDEPANGSNWKIIGPNELPAKGPGARSSQLGTGAQMRIKFQDGNSPAPKILYTCTPSGGLFRTLDATAEKPIWENITDSTRLPVLGVRDMAFVPDDDQTIYIGAGLRYPLELRRLYGIGVLKSTNGGDSWERTGLQFTPPGKREQVCHNIIVDPDSSNIVHALCGPHYYKSVDGGENFILKKTHDLKSPAGWGAAFRDIFFKPDDPRTIYLSTDHEYFFVSKDGGDSWIEFKMQELGVKNPTVRMDIAVTKLNLELVYISCSTTKGAYILRSMDAGNNWEIVFEKRIRTSYERNDFVVSPNDINVLYAGGLYIDRIVLDSTKKNSRTISSGTHLDHRGLLAISDGNGNDIVFSANDGGLYRGHLPEGKKRWEWEDISGIGMNNTQFYGIGVAEDFSVILGGTQDNGVLVGDSTGRFIKPRLGGDGADCTVDKFNPKLVYGTKWDLVPPEVWLCEAGGQNFRKKLKKGIEDTGDSYYLPLEAGEDGNIYFGTRNVYKLPFGESEWQQVGDINLPTDLPYRLHSIAVCPTDPDIIYAVGNLVYKTTNATDDSVVWERISDGMGKASKPYGTGGEISAVTMDPDNPERVWVSIRNFDSPDKVLYSADGGGSWQTVSKGLPPFPINDIVFQAGTNDAVYVGTDVGVFYNPNASDPNAEWLCYNYGLPVCMVADLEMNYCFNKIIAGTFGRSIWESPFATNSVFENKAIENNESWNFRIVRSDITVKKGKTLTLKGEVRLATGKKFFLEKNSKLILDGANIDALCGGTWGGFELVKKPNFIQRFFGAKPGQLEIINNGSVKNAELELP